MDNIKEKLLILNDKFKNIKTYQEFEQLQKDMEDLGYGLVFTMKKTHWQAYGFSLSKNEKVEYLLSDGISTRKCSVERLHYYMKISYSAR